MDKVTNSEEIGAKEALEMIIRGQIGELLFRRVKAPSLDEGNRVTVKLPSGETIRKGQCVTSSNLEKFGVSVNWGPGTVIDEKPKSLRDKVDARVSATVLGGMQMANPSDWFFALIDVLDEERAQSGQSRPVGKDRGIE